MDNDFQRQEISRIDINKEMKKSYIEYAMSVIVSRALPDVRDGLKPVHRRIIYSMSELNLYSNQKHRKSARIVGDVLGKYHPHGEVAIYNAMVRFAQPFTMRYPLVDGQGNYGSIDGDGAAAMRYTEAKMTKLTGELLKDIDKNTVDFIPNFDEEEKEPVVLPSRFPNLLVNGSTGIAVGMATYIPPHNLGEIIDASVALIKDPDISDNELISHVKGPDFPTGAIMMGSQGFIRAYKTGRGSVILRSKHEIEELPNGKTRIIFYEIPYQVNKAKMLEDIAELVKNKVIDGITALRDESNREGIRIVVETRRDVNVNVLLNQLYSSSKLQTSIGMNMVALVDGVPKLMGLKEILTHYLNHQYEVEERRIIFDLKKAKDRAHILEGYKKAIDNIDEVIRIIRSSYNDAELKLMEAFGFTEVQAKAICDLRLRRLQGLEREKIENELRELYILIAELEELLADKAKLRELVMNNLLELKNKFGDERRTDLELDYNEIEFEDMIPKEEVTITLTHRGYIKRVPSDTYVTQNRGGKGITALSKRDEDVVKTLLSCNSHDKLLFFTNTGRAFTLKAYRIPEASRTAMGTALVNLLQLDGEEKIRSVVALSHFDANHYLVFVTKNGLIKKSSLSHYENIRSGGIKAIRINEGDELIDVMESSKNDEFMIISKKGMAIRFEEGDIRAMGRDTAGNKGIKLRSDDEVVSVVRAMDGASLLCISERGYGKQVKLEEFSAQSRGGIGKICYKPNDKTGSLVGAMAVNGDEDILIINSEGVVIRISASSVSTYGRMATGVRLMKLAEDESVVSFALTVMEESDENKEETDAPSDQE